MYKMIYIFLFTLFLSQSYADSNSILIQNNGTKITNLADWETAREKIRFEMQDKIYGFFPTKLSPIFKVLNDKKLQSINARYREIEIHFKELNRDKFIRLGLFLPLEIKRPLPVFLTLNKCGNHTLADDKSIKIDLEISHHPLHCKKFLERGSLKTSYPVKKILDAGYAFATFDKSEMDADDALLEKDGIQGQIQTHKNINKSWGTLAAWAFGLMKSIDYLETDKDIDISRLVVTGHSRRGKAAFLAATMDERIPIVIPHQSGTGGTSNLQDGFFSFQEPAYLMTHGSFIYPLIGEPSQLTHFFSKEFKSWSKKQEKSNLPLSSEMIALIAPRYIMDSQGFWDFWAGASSAKDMLEAASPVWRFYEKIGIKNQTRIEKGQTVLNNKNTGAIIQYMLNTGHIANEAYWDNFIEFADLKLKSKRPSSLLKE